MLEFLNEPNPFSVYSNVESPKITKFSLPLGDIDLDGTGLYIGNNGTVQAENNLLSLQLETSKFIVNNTEEHRPQLEEITYEEPTYSSLNSSNNVKKAMNFFMSKGLSLHAAAGIVGNLMFESGDPTLTKTNNVGDKNLGPKGSSYGIALWRLDRKTALKNFAAKRGKPISDFDILLEFVWDEINNGQKHYKILEGLNNSKNAEEATKHFMNTFERPNSDPKVNGIAKRIKFAKSLS